VGTLPLVGTTPVKDPMSDFWSSYGVYLISGGAVLILLISVCFCCCCWPKSAYEQVPTISESMRNNNNA
jgi:hypothetical protein